MGDAEDDPKTRRTVGERLEKNGGGGFPASLGRFRIRWDRKLGRGSYWTVYAAWDPRTGEQAAVKVQSDLVREETMILEGAFLQRLRGAPGIPALLDWGTESGCRFLALQRLGPNVQDLADKLGGRLKASTAVRLAGILVERLRAIHARNVLHRDVKPENILVGAPFGADRDEIYLIDFGFAKQRDDERRPPTGRKKFVGTPLFASLAAHRGIELGENDDLESAVYALVHLYYGSLPWTPKPGEPTSESDGERDWFPAIAASKASTEADDLIGTGWLAPDHPKKARPMPSCFATALRYVRRMASPTGSVDHGFLIDLFRRESSRLDLSRRWEWSRRSGG